MNQSERRLYLIRSLLSEEQKYGGIGIPTDSDGQRRLLRALMNVRPPRPISDGFLRVQDEYLRAVIRGRGMTELRGLEPVRGGIYLWQGDITALRCDAIVNAANSALLGCFCPGHGCVDNAIHSYAGVQLRLACAELMEAQGHPEPTGRAKLTPAFNLPCRYVLHTVGPIVTGAVTARDRRLLGDCYRSCLELAAENGLESVAFCCISTGEFRFPAEAAARIAVQTVTDFLRGESSVERVIFNVFTDRDREIYARLLGAGGASATCAR